MPEELTPEQIDEFRQFADGPPITTFEEQQQAGIREQQLRDKHGPAPVRFVKGATEGVGLIAREIGTWAAIESDKLLNEKTQLWYQPQGTSDWSPGTDDRQRKLIDDEIEKLALDPNGSEAKALRGSTSVMDLYRQSEHMRDSIEDMQKVASYGTAGLAGYMFGSFVDVDSVVGFGAFKTSLKSQQINKLAEMQQAGKFTVEEANALKSVTSRMSNIGEAAKIGAAVGAGSEVALSVTDPVHDLQDIGASVLLTAGMAGGLGALVKPRTINEVSEYIMASRVMQEAEKPPVNQEAVTRIKEAEERFEHNASQAHAMMLDESVGSARLEQAEVYQTEATKDVINMSYDFLESNPQYTRGITEFTDFVEETASPVQKGLQKSTEKFYEGLNKIGLAPDFDKNIRSGNAVLQSLAIQLQTSPVGQIINHSSGDNIADQVFKEVSSIYAPHKTRLLLQWAQERGVQASDMLNIPRSGDARTFADPMNHVKFSKEVQEYMAYKREGDPRADRAPEAVKEMADHLNETYKRIIREHKKAGTEDYLDIPEADWYFKHNWNGTKIRRLEDEIGSARLIDGLSEAIRRKSPDVAKELRDVWATAIVRASKDKNLTSPIGSLGTASDSAKGHLIEIIEQQGLSDRMGMTAEDIANKMLYQDSDRGKLKATRNRIDLDVTAEIPGTGQTVLSLLDNDVLGATDITVRGQSAEIGRLRGTGGKLQRRDIDTYRRAVRAEAQAIGADPDAHQKLFDNMIGQFTEEAFGGGINRNIGRLNKLTTLSFMAQLGMPSISEIGITMGAGGIKGMEAYIGKSFRDVFKGIQDDRLLNSLAHSDVYRTPQELYTTSADLDEVASMSPDKLGRLVDSSLDVGGRAMGHVSGGYAAHKVTQMYAMKVANMLMYDIGSNPAAYARRKREGYGVNDEIIRIVEENKQHFTVDENGAVLDNGFDRWANQEDAEIWRRAIARQTDWMVQITRRGETHAWAYTDAGALFTRLRSFALNALHSKAVRSGRQADRAAASMFLAQLSTAAMAYSAKETLNGRADQLGPERIATGSLNWSAQLSPVLMLIDPLAYYAGADYFVDAGLHSEAFKRRDFGAIPTPAAASAVASYAEMLRAPGDMLDDGRLDWKTANAIRAFPILGRVYGVNGIIQNLQE